MSYWCQTEANGKLTLTPTTFMFTQDPVQNRNGWKTPHKWVLGASSRVVGAKCPYCSIALRCFQVPCFLATRMLLSFQKFPLSEPLWSQTDIKHYLGLPYHPNTTLSHHLPNCITIHMIKGSKSIILTLFFKF
jgi:hypothetical protein